MSKAPRHILVTFQTGVSVTGIPQYVTHTIRKEINRNLIRDRKRTVIESFEHSSERSRPEVPRK